MTERRRTGNEYPRVVKKFIPAVSTYTVHAAEVLFYVPTFARVKPWEW